MNNMNKNDFQNNIGVYMHLNPPTHIHANTHAHHTKKKMEKRNLKKNLQVLQKQRSRTLQPYSEMPLTIALFQDPPPPGKECTHPSWFSLTSQTVAHLLWNRGVPLCPKLPQNSGKKTGTKECPSYWSVQGTLRPERKLHKVRKLINRFRTAVGFVEEGPGNVSRRLP